MIDALSDAVHNYSAYEYPVASTQLFLAMLGMGALLAPRDFLLEVKQPRALLAGFGFQWLLVPVIAYVLGSVLLGQVLHLAHRDGITLTIVATFRNISLAIAVKATVFPARPGVLDPIGDAVLFVALLYAGVSMFMMLALVGYQRWKFSHAHLQSKESGL